MTAEVNRASVWTRYWATGAANSCNGGVNLDYGGATAEHWRQVFAALPKTAAHVLDIGTGNGPLPRLLLSCRHEADLRCDAVDCADVAPSWSTADGRVRFHARTAAEALPFADASFDLAMSQYGLEYSDTARAAQELRRVLKATGVVSLVVHRQGSRPVTLAQHEIEHVDWLLGESGLVACAEAMIDPLSRVADPQARAGLAGDANANRARDAFNTAQEATHARILASACPDVLHESRDQIGSALKLALAGDSAAAHDALAQLRLLLVDDRWRLTELRSHALDEAAVQTLAQRLQRPQDRVRIGALEHDGHAMGWLVDVGP